MGRFIGLPQSFYMFKNTYGEAATHIGAGTIPSSIAAMYELGFALVAPAIVACSLSGMTCITIIHQFHFLEGITFLRTQHVLVLLFNEKFRSCEHIWVSPFHLRVAHLCVLPIGAYDVDPSGLVPTALH